MQIWDTAGQESFKSVTRIFYRGAHCVFLTYDITRDETFVSLAEWLKEIKQHAAEDVRIYLVGNKSEMSEQREISFERAIEFAKKNGIHKCFETSAKTGASVEDLFSCAGKNLYQQLMRELTNDAKGSGTYAINGGQSTVGLAKNGGIVKKDKGCC